MTDTTLEPDVTFVIAAYNAAETIACAVASARAQRGVCVEVVVVDDCSSDGTRDVVLAFADPAVRLVALDRNRGPGGARNAGFDAARGRWVAVLDSDDAVHPERLSAMLAVAERENADVAVDNIEVVSPDGRSERMFAPELLGCLSWLTLADFIASNVLFEATHNFGYMKPVFRRRFLEENRLRFDEDLRIGEDYLLLASALALGAKCRVVPETGYVYHIRDGSISRVLKPHHVEAMLAADARFLLRFPLGTAAAAAQARRTRSLEEARSFLAIVGHLKNLSPRGALKVALGDPRALRHLRMPIAARLRRLAAPLARRKAAAHRAALPQSTTELSPFKSKG
ncbi:glycosyltransferase [Rhizobium sp. TRM95111]|uniref:glycosyltransferase family 2 protein n=1 Tax=Rhizobium alarense TaxID=2846851 RepID=UPI001F1D6AB9|nr:glycosyltransferase family 2 protein [Rhizobium alarense]MCF3638937.1 glycosyltransferase [Rhizobium alarense]